MFFFTLFTERLNGHLSANRRRKTNFDSWRLSSSNPPAINKSRRKIPEENPTKNQKQGQSHRLLLTDDHFNQILFFFIVQISAQESRRKKKEYMDQLERKVQLLVTENNDCRKKIESLEDSNNNLMSQLAKLQQIVARTNPQLLRQMKQ